MGRKRTPPPEPPELRTARGCAVRIGVVGGVFALATAFTRWWWLLIFCLPGLLVFVYWIYGKTLLLHAICAYKPRNIVGVLVTSDSPNWELYIREKWLPRLGDRFVLLNWSQRKRWNHSLATSLFFHFCARKENFCPAIIFLRGLRHPLIFRFFYAFRDYKHGNEAALRRLEQRLFEELRLG